MKSSKNLSSRTRGVHIWPINPSLSLKVPWALGQIGRAPLWLKGESLNHILGGWEGSSLFPGEGEDTQHKMPVRRR